MAQAMPTMATPLEGTNGPTNFPRTTNSMHRPITAPMQAFPTPQPRDDREHKGEGDQKQDTMSVLTELKEKDKSKTGNLNITPDMASKILKLIEAKSQNYEKQHKAAATTQSSNSAAKLKNLLEEEEKLRASKLDDSSLPSAESLAAALKDEENIQVQKVAKHEPKAKATSTHPTNTADVEYPGPKLPMLEGLRLKPRPSISMNKPSVGREANDKTARVVAPQASPVITAASVSRPLDIPQPQHTQLVTQPQAPVIQPVQQPVATQVLQQQQPVAEALSPVYCL